MQLRLLILFGLAVLAARGAELDAAAHRAAIAAAQHAVLGDAGTPGAWAPQLTHACGASGTVVAASISGRPALDAQRVLHLLASAAAQIVPTPASLGQLAATALALAR